MPQPASKIKLDQWRAKVTQQRESRLSIASWCHQNDIAVHTFYYWRNRLFPKTTIKRSDFEEIPEQQKPDTQNQKSGVRLMYQEFCIHLELQFDTETLKLCLKALKELPC
jgi:hypothetical protein